MATKAWGRYLGSEAMATLVRHSCPISPMSDPSRAYTREDWAGWTRRQGSSLSGASCCANVGADAEPRRTKANAAATRRRNGQARQMTGTEVGQVPVGCA